ncbi:MAG: helix-turn-helix transcriptional regulator [Tissierellia bacterium]|nr:helix-turn-helix transcriptional regulator [Tissierellia bacterium]
MNTLDRVKKLVATKGISLAELERRTGLGNGTISRWDKSLPTGDKLQRVAKELGTTIDYLVSGEDEENAKAKIIARNASSLTDEQLDLINSMIEHLKSNK